MCSECAGAPQHGSVSGSVFSLRSLRPWANLAVDGDAALASVHGATTSCFFLFFMRIHSLEEFLISLRQGWVTEVPGLPLLGYVRLLYL